MKRAKHNNFLFYNGKFIQAFSPPFITEETLQLNAFICTQVTYKLFFFNSPGIYSMFPSRNFIFRFTLFTY